MKDTNKIFSWAHCWRQRAANDDDEALMFGEENRHQPWWTLAQALSCHTDPHVLKNVAQKCHQNVALWVRTQPYVYGWCSHSKASFTFAITITDTTLNSLCAIQTQMHPIIAVLTLRSLELRLTVCTSTQLTIIVLIPPLKRWSDDVLFHIHLRHFDSAAGFLYLLNGEEVEDILDHDKISQIAVEIWSKMWIASKFTSHKHDVHSAVNCDGRTLQFSKPSVQPRVRESPFGDPLTQFKTWSSTISR